MPIIIRRALGFQVNHDVGKKVKKVGGDKYGKFSENEDV